MFVLCFLDNVHASWQWGQIPVCMGAETLMALILVFQLLIAVSKLAKLGLFVPLANSDRAQGSQIEFVGFRQETRTSQL